MSRAPGPGVASACELMPCGCTANMQYSSNGASVSSRSWRYASYTSYTSPQNQHANDSPAHWCFAVRQADVCRRVSIVPTMHGLRSSHSSHSPAAAPVVSREHTHPVACPSASVGRTAHGRPRVGPTPRAGAPDESPPSVARLKGACISASWPGSRVPTVPVRFEGRRRPKAARWHRCVASREA